MGTEAQSPGEPRTRLRLPMLAGLVLVVIAVASLAATSPLGTLGQWEPQTPRRLPSMTATHQTSVEASGTPTPPPPRATWQAPSALLRVTPFLLALAALVLLAIMVRLIAAQLHRRGAQRATAAIATGQVLTDDDLEQVLETLDQGLSHLRSGLAVDDAIVECWRRLEEIAAQRGIERQPQHTASEFVTRLLADTTASADDLLTLAELYRAAMFSGRSHTEIDRTRAIDCLARLRDTLSATGAAR